MKRLKFRGVGIVTFRLWCGCKEFLFTYQLGKDGIGECIGCQSTVLLDGVYRDGDGGKR